MEKRKMLQIFICCSCFLAVIYGIARLDKGHRRYREEDAAAMASKEQDNIVFAQQRIMYLTFEDGPGPYTQDILNILDDYHIKATFFVTGLNNDYTHLLKTVSAEGHMLGLHSFSHDCTEIYSSVEAYFTDLGKISSLVKKETNTVSDFIRFPLNTDNTESLSYDTAIIAKLHEHCENLGYTYYDWNVDSGDEDPDLTADEIYENVIQKVQGKDKVMLRMHDGNTQKATKEALPRILKELVRQGWEFRIIDDSTETFHQNLD